MKPFLIVLGLALLLTLSLSNVAFGSDDKKNWVEEGQPFPLLKIDLTKGLKDSLLSRVQDHLRQEKSRARGEYRHSLILAQGIVEMGKLNWKEARRKFDRVPSDSVLKEGAKFLLAKSYFGEGEERFLIGKFDSAAEFCKKSLDQLTEFQALNPFIQGESKELLKDARKCWVLSSVEDQEAKKVEKEILYTLAEKNSDLSKKERDNLERAIENLHPVSVNEKGKRAQLKIKFQENHADELLDFKPAEESADEKRYRDARILNRSRKILGSLKKLVSIYEDFPGSALLPRVHSKIEALTSRILTKASERRQKRALEYLRKLPPKAMYEVAKTIWEEDLEEDARDLFLSLVKWYAYTEQAGNAYYFLGRIAENQRQWRIARRYFEKVVGQYSGSPFYERSRFKVAWHAYLLGETKKATRLFEIEFYRSQSPRVRSQALYWMAKSYKARGDANKTSQLASMITELNPFSYYGALLQSYPKFVVDKEKTSQLKGQSFLSNIFVHQAYGFLAAGFPSAARSALSVAVEMESDWPSDELKQKEIARLYHLAGNHLSSIQLAHQMVNENRSSAVEENLGSYVFPLRFETEIHREAGRKNLDPLILLSLIKQESAFQDRAESRTGALGAMQLMMETARSTARKEKIPLPTREDLLRSEINIRLGTAYLAQQLDSFNGNLAFALGAYNAGPQNMKPWTQRWEGLPLDVFVELIPFEETRSYVKSILRNYAMYSFMLKKRKVDLHSVAHLPIKKLSKSP